MRTHGIIFKNCEDLMREHESSTWDEFREFVKYATEDYADIGCIGCDNCDVENIKEMTAVFFHTEDGVGNVLNFPFTNEEFLEEIEKNGIFKDE